jgi:flagellar hook-length control protein FliK
MTPSSAAPAAAPAAAIDSGGGSLEMSGASLADALTGGDAAPFSAALAILQDPLLTGSITDKPAGKQDEAAQIQLPAAAVDPATAALAAVLQWLRQSTANLPQAGHEQSAAKAATDAGTSIGAIAGGSAAAAPVLPALLAAQFKTQMKSSDGAAINTAAGQGANAGATDTSANAATATATATATAAAGAVGKPQVGLPAGINNPLPQELQALASALGQPVADHASSGSQGERASDVNVGALTAIDTLASSPDNTGGSAASAVAGLDRGADARSTASAVPTERTVSVPVHDRHWSQAIAAQVLVLADHRIESATLRLTPEHLGPVDVHIDIQDSQVNVNFGAAHADTRSALEQALPRLREVLAGAGLTLGDASVQQQLRRGSQNRGDGARAAGEPADTQPVTLSASLRAIGMIDEYA